MSTYIIFFIILLILIVIFLVYKLLSISVSIKEIQKNLESILNSDTNHLITTSTNNKSINNLANNLNTYLKKFRKQELFYKKGNQELQELITNISHDLRTPLTAIKGYLDLMDYGNLTYKQTKYLKIINNKVEDLSDLTEQFFDFTKSKDMQDEIKRENICINDILEDSIVSFYRLFKERNITPNIDICKDKVVRLVNENILKRIFENIISNAIKYSKRDFNVKMYNDGTIEFSNKTDKLDKVSLEKMFNRYYTVQNAKKSTGIGLSIAKQLVELCNGTIEAKYKNNVLTIYIKFLK